MTKRITNPYANGRGPKPLSIAEKLARSSERQGECLVWTSGTDKDGYGKVWHERRSWRSHILAFVNAYGHVPSGLLVLHTCDRPPCIEITHLYAGTPGDNMADRSRRGRWVGGRPKATHCPKGHPYNKENAYINTRGHQECRICISERGKLRRTG